MNPEKTIVAQVRAMGDQLLAKFMDIGFQMIFKRDHIRPTVLASGCFTKCPHQIFIQVDLRIKIPRPFHGFTV
jgi:hypothetical protein